MPDVELPQIKDHVLGRGYWSGGEKLNIAIAESAYGRITANDVANIESAAQERMNQVQADAAKYGYDISLEEAQRTALATEYAAYMNKLGVTESADRYALAQEFSARMGLSEAERSALAQEFTAREQSGAQRYTADKSVDVAKEHAQAQVRSTEISAKADMYGADSARQAQTASSGIQSAGNTVSSAFSAFNTSQRMGQQWAYQRSHDRRSLFRNSISAALVFLLGMGVLLIAMDIIGIPIIASLTAIIAEAGARAMYLVEALRDGGGNAGDAFAGYAAGIGATIGGLLTALWDKMNDFLDWLYESIMDLVAQVGG